MILLDRHGSELHTNTTAFLLSFSKLLAGIPGLVVSLQRLQRAGIAEGMTQTPVVVSGWWQPLLVVTIECSTYCLCVVAWLISSTVALSWKDRVARIPDEHCQPDMALTAVLVHALPSMVIGLASL